MLDAPRTGPQGYRRPMARDDSRAWVAAFSAASRAARATQRSCTRCCCGPRASSSGGAAPRSPRAAGELDDLATQAAGDAMMAMLAQARQLPRREPLHDLGVQVRAAGGRREGAAPVLARARDPARGRRLGGARRWRPVRRTRCSRTPRRSRAIARRDAERPDAAPAFVFVALALNDVPIDVLAERLETTRGALYKTLHDARRKLRAVLADECGDAGAEELRCERGLGET